MQMQNIQQLELDRRRNKIFAICFLLADND